MGNSQSNSINAQINQIMEDSVASPSLKASETPVITFDKKSKPIKKYVKTDTEGTVIAPVPTKTDSITSSAPVPTGVLSATSTEAPIIAPVPTKTDSITSSAPVPSVVLSATSTEGKSITSSAPVPTVTFSPTSTEGVRRDRRVRRPNQSVSSLNVVVLNPNIFVTSDDMPTVMSEAPKMVATKTGGYTYAAELSELKGGYTYAGESSGLTGGANVIKLDSAIFDSEIEGGNNNGEEKKSSEFNPEKFFQDMQKGGLREPRNKEHKKNRIERYLDSSLEDDDSGFDFAESTEGLDIDENEDTEDIKQKVKTLRAMVSRSKGKKSKGKKSKRMTTESSGGASENSISTYLDSTSSISTSDVRLISMNKIKK